jgi:Holliday junction DNA helicase RuvA
MIAFVKGIIAHKGIEHVIIEASGIGYRIYSSSSAIQSLGGIGSEAMLLTHYHVREDAALLYGFPTKEELGIFEMLISVSGVGPKAALSLLSCMPPAKFSMAVVSGDFKALSKAPGVGLKTAQRIIVELGDKIRKSHGTTGPESNSLSYDSGFQGTGGGTKAAEAVNALMVLGYSPVEASKAVGDVYDDKLEIEDIIMKSLKSLSKL